LFAASDLTIRLTQATFASQRSCGMDDSSTYPRRTYV